MKKLIITILAMATMALAANKPVCRETRYELGSIDFTCVRPEPHIKEITIRVWVHEKSITIFKAYANGRSETTHAEYDSEIGETYMTDWEYDDLGVQTLDKERWLPGDKVQWLYDSVRDEYDLRRKN